MLHLFSYVMCVDRNTACNVFCSQSLCEVVLTRCHEVHSKSPLVSSCRAAVLEFDVGVTVMDRSIAIFIRDFGAFLITKEIIP